MRRRDQRPLHADRKIIKCIASLWLFVFTGTLCAQISSNEPSSTKPPGPAQSAQIQPTLPATVLLKKVVVFLSVDYRDQGQLGQLRGTAFFVAYEDNRLGPNRGFIYLVTNRHMAEPQKDGRKFSITRISIRLNLKSGIAASESEDLLLSVGGGLPWIFPQDDAVDLAILSFAPDANRYDYAPFPTSMFATKNIIESRAIAEGDPVDFAGFFYQFPGQTKMEPFSGREIEESTLQSARLVVKEPQRREIGSICSSGLGATRVTFAPATGTSQ